MKTESYSVITGASKGLGKELAIAAARRGMNLILVALPGEGIREVAAELARKFDIRTHGYDADLTDAETLEKFTKWINHHFEVNMLINNAGIGGSIPFEEASAGYIDNIVMLNIRAPVLLTHALLPNMKRQEKAYILNISSMASFSPLPFKTIYPASKAFVWSFSRGLNAELKDTNVLVSVAHPGPMTTKPGITNRKTSHGWLAQKMYLSPEKVAESCFYHLSRDHSHFIPGIFNKLFWFTFAMCPVWLRLNIFKRPFIKEIRLKKQRSYA